MNYLIYPLKKVAITQTYNGTTSHKPHTTGNLKDYPIDDNCGSTAKDGYFYCPCDEVVIKRIYGVGNSGTNTIWMQSTSKVTFADGTKDYATIMVCHPDDDQLKKLSVGQKFTRKQAMFLEGKNGATGYHHHIAVGKGTYKGNGWVKNSNGKWVLTSSNGAVKPENAFYIDTSFTTISNKAGLVFKNKPAETSTSSNNSFFPSKGYFGKGDVDKNIGKIATFMRKLFPKYTSEKALGNTYGPYLMSAVTTFQTNAKKDGRYNGAIDGLFGPKTLSALVSYGFKY